MPLLIFPAAFCCDPEAEADLRCGLAAVFLAGASLDFLPSIASAFPSARSWPCGDLPIALQPSSIGSKFRMMRIGCSLRTHRRIAVDAVTGSLPWINPTAGITAATASGKKCMMTKPITALQNPNHYPG